MIEGEKSVYYSFAYTYRLFSSTEQNTHAKYVYPLCLCAHLFQKDWKEEALFQKFRSLVSAWVDRNEMDSWSMKPGLSQQQSWASQAKSVKVAAEKLRTAISVTVWTHLWVSGLFSSVPTVKHQKPTSFPARCTRCISCSSFHFLTHL